MIVQSSGPVDPDALAERLRCDVVLDNPLQLRCAVASTPERIAIVTNYLASVGLSWCRCARAPRSKSATSSSSPTSEATLTHEGPPRPDPRRSHDDHSTRRDVAAHHRHSGAAALLFLAHPRDVVAERPSGELHRSGHPRALRAVHVARGSLDRDGFRAFVGVLRRLHVTPLGQRRLVGAKIAGVLVTETHPSHRHQRWSRCCSPGTPTELARCSRGRRPHCCSARSARRASASPSRGGYAPRSTSPRATASTSCLLLLSGIVVPLTSLPVSTSTRRDRAAVRARWPKRCTGSSAMEARRRSLTGCRLRRLGRRRTAARGAHLPIRLSFFSVLMPLRARVFGNGAEVHLCHDAFRVDEDALG